MALDGMARTHTASRIESNVRFSKHRVQRWLEETPDIAFLL
jgi:hypothetical protein